EPLAVADLAQLRECSLVSAGEEPAGMRFRMLETLREYAAEQLSAEELATLERRRAEYHLAEAPRRRGEADRDWLERSEAELDNFRAALAWEWRTSRGSRYSLRSRWSISGGWEVSTPKAGRYWSGRWSAGQ